MINTWVTTFLRDPFWQVTVGQALVLWSLFLSHWGNKRWARIITFVVAVPLTALAIQIGVGKELTTAKDQTYLIDANKTLQKSVASVQTEAVSTLEQIRTIDAKILRMNGDLSNAYNAEQHHINGLNKELEADRDNINHSLTALNTQMNQVHSDLSNLSVQVGSANAQVSETLNRQAKTLSSQQKSINTVQQRQRLKQQEDEQFRECEEENRRQQQLYNAAGMGGRTSILQRDCGTLQGVGASEDEQ